MPQKRRSPRAEETPAGHLAEAQLQSVLGYQLAQAAIVTNAVFFAHAGEPFGLRPVEYTVLTLIAENPGGSLARIARALAVTAPNITVMVDRLEARGLVLRQHSEEDRRTQVLHPTPKGADLVRKATERIIEGEKATIPLTPGERAMLLELLHKVACARPSPGFSASPPGRGLG